MFLVALKNTLRNKRRIMISLFLVVSGTCLVAFMRFLTYGFTQDMISNSIGLDSGFLEIAAYGWKEKQSLNRALELNPRIFKAIDQEKNIQSRSVRIKSGALLNFQGKTKFISILAADPQAEQKITTIHKTLIEGEWIKDLTDLPGSVMGFRLAKYLNIKPGQHYYLVTSQLDGSSDAMQLRLSGIFDSKNSGLDSSRILINLKSGQELFGTHIAQKDYATSIALGVVDPLQSEKTKLNLAAQFPQITDAPNIDPQDSDIYDPVVLDWRDLNPGMIELINIADWKMGIFFVFMIISIAFGVLNSVQMSIQERVREFGVLLAIGTKPTQLFVMISWEIFFLLVPGVLLGVLIAASFGSYFHHHPIELSGTMGEMYKSMGYLPRWRPIVHGTEVFKAIAIMVLPTFAIALLSTRRVFKLVPTQIINTI